MKEHFSDKDDFVLGEDKEVERASRGNSDLDRPMELSSGRAKYDELDRPMTSASEEPCDDKLNPDDTETEDDDLLGDDVDDEHPLDDTGEAKSARKAYQSLKEWPDKTNDKKPKAVDVDALRVEIKMIPKDTDRAKLPEELHTTFWILADMDKAIAESVLLNDITPHFGLSRDEIKIYRSTINDLRKRLEKSKIEKAKSNSKVEFSTYFVGLVDLVRSQGKPTFLVKIDARLVGKREHVTDEGIKLVPPDTDDIPWLLPRAEEVIKHYEVEDADGLDRELFNDVMSYQKSISDLPSEKHYEFLTAWVMHSYLQESFEYTPIVCLQAVHERGKTRTGKGLLSIVWRGIHIESLNQAFIFRAAESYKATLFFDVKNLMKRLERAGSEDLILSRFEKGLKVPRVLYPDRGPFKDTKFFTIFGLTVLGTNEPIDEILASRSIEITMQPTSKKFNKDVKQTDGLVLKERLLAFRARHFDKPLEEIEKPANGRLGDILRPIQLTIRLACPEREKSFLEFVQIVLEERAKAESETFEVKVFKAVVELETKVKNGILPNMDIAERVNDGTPERFHVSPHRIASMLKGLGFDRAKTSDGSSAIHWNQKLINQLIVRYNLNKNEIPI